MSATRRSFAKFRCDGRRNRPKWFKYRVRYHGGITGNHKHSHRLANRTSNTKYNTGCNA